MRVDTGKIDGYADMSIEDKLKALEAYEFDAPTDTGELDRLKEALNKATSEAAANKRALREKQSAEEQKAAADAEEREKILKELEALKKDKAISMHKTSYMELGFEADMAEANAKALYAGDFNTVFANHKKFIESQKKAAAAGAMDGQPALTEGAPISGKDIEGAVVSAFRKAAGLG